MVVETWRGIAADEPWKKQRLFGIRIKRVLHDRLSGRGTHRRRKACACQLPEALLGLQERIRVLRIEIVPSIAGAIHHDLCGHRILRCKVPEFYARFRLTRKPNDGTFAAN